MLSWLFYTSGVDWLATFDYTLSGKKKVEGGFLGIAAIKLQAGRMGGKRIFFLV